MSELNGGVMFTENALRCVAQAEVLQSISPQCLSWKDDTERDGSANGRKKECKK